MGRKRMNRLAICSSDNYNESKKLHKLMLDERHSHFCGVTISGEVCMDQPIIKDGKILPKYKTIRIFGKQMKLTIEEYNTHCKEIGL